MGVKGGLVLFVTDDPGPISSQTEQDTRRFAAFAKVPVLDPSTVEQGFDMMQAAFDLSEAYQTPVIVRSSTRICHASTFMEVPAHMQTKEVEGFERSSRWVIFPKRAYEAHKEINDRLVSISQDFSKGPLSDFNTVSDYFVQSSPAKKGIAAAGVSASYVKEALDMIEQECEAQSVTVPPCRFLHVGTAYPFPEGYVDDFAQGLEEIIVIEELDHVLEDDIQKLCGKTKASYEVQGKLSGHARDRGENTVDDIKRRLLRFLELDLEPDEAQNELERPGGNTYEEPPALPIRPPVLCAGCPHRGSFYAIKQTMKKLGKEAIYCGDIGCYTLGNAQPLDAVDTCLCMGAGITMAQGFSIVEPSKKQLAFVGDSTFFASGLPGVVNAIYNNHDICVVVLDNSITAMTGAQPHPGTGDTLMGERRPGISIEAVLQAIGFSHIEYANPFDLQDSMRAAEKAIEVQGPSALIYRAPCINIVKPGIPSVIDEEACTGCKRCIREIGCPAISFDFDARKARIEPSLCTGCGLCTDLCPFGAIEFRMAQLSTNESSDAARKEEPYV